MIDRFLQVPFASLIHLLVLIQFVYELLVVRGTHHVVHEQCDRSAIIVSLFAVFLCLGFRYTHKDVSEGVFAHVLDVLA